MRSSQLTAIGLVMVGLAAALGAGPAQAHARLVGSTPANGASVAADLGAVTLRFNEDMQPSNAIVNVVGPDGRYRQQDGTVHVSGQQATEQVRLLGPVGSYTINYRIISADGHPVGGKRGFTLPSAGTGSPGAIADTADYTTSDGIAGWEIVLIVLAAFIVAVGLPLLIIWWRTRRRGART